MWIDPLDRQSIVEQREVGLMKKLRAAFITGCLVLIPLLATIQLILWFIQTIDANIRNIFPSGLLPFDFRGLGIILALVLIILTGLSTQNYIGRWFIALFNQGMRKTGIVGGIYSSIQKFLEAVLNSGQDQFHGTVLIQFPREGIYSIGFRTGKPDSKLLKVDKKNLTNIFVPCTPNPTSGFYLLVPESELIPLELSVQEAFKIIISMGMVTSDEAERTGHF
jgi:uncharacterized membrane protein